MSPIIKEIIFLGIPALVRFIHEKARQRRLDREAREDRLEADKEILREYTEIKRKQENAAAEVRSKALSEGNDHRGG